MSFLFLLLGGVIALTAAYSISCAFRKKEFNIKHFVEAGACGAGIVAGLHLGCGAFHPEMLVELDPATCNGAAIKVTMSDFHAVHVLIGALVTVAASVIPLGIIFK